MSVSEERKNFRLVTLKNVAKRDPAFGRVYAVIATAEDGLLQLESKHGMFFAEEENVQDAK